MDADQAEALDYFTEQISLKMDIFNLTKTKKILNEWTRCIKSSIATDLHSTGIMTIFYIEIFAKYPSHHPPLARILADFVKPTPFDNGKKNAKCHHLEFIGLNVLSFQSDLYSTLLEKICACKDEQVKTFLIGQGFIIAHELESQVARDLINAVGEIVAWGRTGVIKEKRNFNWIVENAFSIDSVSFSRSDVTHIRNAFAHSYFRLLDDGLILVWDMNDVEGEKKKETFRKTLKNEDLLKYLLEYKSRLGLVEILMDLIILKGFEVGMEISNVKMVDYDKKVQE